VKVEMTSREVKPNYDTYQALIAGLCRLGKRLAGQSIMLEMIESNFHPNEAICAALVCGFCKKATLIEEN
jgi:pentatricopeptide repeat protein